MAQDRGQIVDERKTFCRICTTHCGMIVSVDKDEQLVAIRPDKDDIHTKGFACFKGLSAPEAHAADHRILHPLKRQPDGTFKRVALEQALDEIAAKLKEVIANHGAAAVGGFRGTGAGYNAGACVLMDGFMSAIGSPKIFTANTIDQSAKVVAMERMGYWPPGPHTFRGSDVILIFGANPNVSLVVTEVHNPVKKMKEEIAKGVKILVIDPRETETARMAHTFLQPLPGEDPTIVSGMIRLILERGWEDKEFVARYAGLVDELRDAVAPFTPEYVARRADVPVSKFVEITEVFARAKRGRAVTGVGPSMAQRSNLTEHLVQCLNVLCGRFLREGEEIDNPGFLTKRYEKRCQVVPPARSWEKGFKSRIQGYGLLPCIHEPELPTGIMTDEILEDGPDRIKAFFVHGGNPAVVVPDQHKVVRAFRSLDLLVTIEPYMTPTAKLSHYILPTYLQYERPDLPLWMMEQSPYPFYNESFTRYTPAVVKVPLGAELASDGEIFWGVAKRLGVVLTSMGVPLDMTRKPTPDDLLGIVARNAVVPLEEIKKHPMGITQEGGPQLALPALPGADARFALAPYDIVAELREVAEEEYFQRVIVSNGSRATHRVVGRRLRHMHNSQQRTLPSTRRRLPYNTAFVHPDDLADIGVGSGDMIRVSSELATIEIMAMADSTLRRGVIAIPYGFGDLPGEAKYELHGVTPNLLISTDCNLEPINAMPRMSAFPAAISPAEGRDSPVAAGQRASLVAS